MSNEPCHTQGFLEAILTLQKFSIWPDTEKFLENIYCSLRMQSECQFEFDTKLQEQLIDLL